MAATMLGMNPKAIMTSTPRAGQGLLQVQATVRSAVGEAVLNHGILANAITQAPQAFFERFDKGQIRLSGSDGLTSDPVDPTCRLLHTSSIVSVQTSALTG